MGEAEPRVAIGMMSGTSMDGIDAAVIRTDGERVDGFGPALTASYDEAFRASLRGVVGPDPGPDTDAVEHELTRLHAGVARTLAAQCEPPFAPIDVIGFHGHTVFHDPAAGTTRQIGDGAYLAAQTGIQVVCDFRGRDMAEGGGGAPLAPLFHVALAARLARPVAVLNVGGVANVTWIGEDGRVSAFDTGPGNALIDDWVARTTGKTMDADGHLARSGRVEAALLDRLLDHPYFDRPPPKSLDRDAFDPAPLAGLSPADGAATLSAFTAAAVARAKAFFPEPPRRWLVCGGGRRNPVLMEALHQAVAAPVLPVEAVGWNGDALEAQAFGFLAVRSLRGLPLTLPETTGVRAPVSGGTLYHPA